MAAKAISDEVKQRVQEAVDRFNREVLRSRRVQYVPRFKGKFLYLDRAEGGAPSPICRLTWTGSFENWDFAIYKYSDDAYDSQEWFFPGSECVDGTIEGAMKAGLAAYPG